MRPLPTGKLHGVVHSVQVKKEDVDALAKHLNIPDDRKQWLKDGGQIHIVREAKPDEMSKKQP